MEACSKTSEGFELPEGRAMDTSRKSESGGQLAASTYKRQEGQLVWRKSSHSSNGGCVEVAVATDRILVRDSKDRNGPVLDFNFVEWKAFLAGLRDGEFDIHNS